MPRKKDSKFIKGKGKWKSLNSSCTSESNDSEDVEKMVNYTAFVASHTFVIVGLSQFFHSLLYKMVAYS